MICEGPKCADERTASCGQPMSLKAVKDRSDGVTWRCRKVHDVLKNGKHTCVKDVKLSIRHNTWIEDSNLSLEVILELIYLWTQGMNQLELSHELGISERSLIEWRAYFRDVCTYICLKESQAIGGPGVEVEIDESKFGKRKYYRGHRVDGKWVFGGREKNDKSKIFMFAVDNRKKPTLIPLIKKWIRPGSIIHSDCFKTYHCLPKLGYTHLTVNHSKEFKNKETGACTNKIECEWRHAKVAMPDYGVHRGLHDGYLAKFLWHRKYYDKDKFLTLIGHCNEAFTQKQMECIKC